MMKKTALLLFLGFIFTVGMATGVRAATIGLADWGFNINGFIYDKFDSSLVDFPGVVPAEVDSTGFSFDTGLGSMTAEITTTGANYVDLYVDHDIDKLLNLPTNEIGKTIGSPVAGQSWEIDTSGITPLRDGTGGLPYIGDIFAFNFVDSTLDNKIFYDGFDGQSLEGPEDVTMAMGWDFSLLADQKAIITWNIFEGVFEGNAAIFFSSELNISGGDPGTAPLLSEFSLLQIDPDSAVEPIPEPSTLILLGLGMAGLVATRKRWGKRYFTKPENES